MSKAFYVLRGIQFYSEVQAKIESVIGRCVFKTNGFYHNGWAVPSYQVFAYSGGAEMKYVKSQVCFKFPETDPDTVEYMARFCVAYSDSAAGIVDIFAKIASASLSMAVMSNGCRTWGAPPELAGTVSMSKPEQNEIASRYVEALRSRLDLELSMRGLC